MHEIGGEVGEAMVFRHARACFVSRCCLLTVEDSMESSGATVMSKDVGKGRRTGELFVEGRKKTERESSQTRIVTYLLLIC